MNDNCKVSFVGQGQVAVEPSLLQLKRGAIPVSVQSRFAHGDDGRPCDQFGDRPPVILAGFRSLVGVDADRREQTAV